MSILRVRTRPMIETQRVTRKTLIAEGLAANIKRPKNNFKLPRPYASS